MAESLRQIRRRIRSVESIHKMTGAMEMVASSKIRALERGLLAGERYFSVLRGMLNGVLAAFPEHSHPLLVPSRAASAPLLCLFTSDSGLCGSYNTAVLNRAEAFLRERAGEKPALVLVGKKGISHFQRRGFEVAASYPGLFGRYRREVAEEIAGRLAGFFLSGKASAVHLIYTARDASRRYAPVQERFLPVERPPAASGARLSEPSPGELLAVLLPAFLSAALSRAMLAAFAAEQAIRAWAMHEATENASELFDDLIIQRNKIRQAEITRDITEVISSAEALRR